MRVMEGGMTMRSGRERGARRGGMRNKYKE